MKHPPGMQLACALGDLPGHCRDFGLIHQIQTAFYLFCHNRLWSKRDMVRLAVATHFHRYESAGKGNRAAKREAQVETAQWFDENQLSEADVMAIAEDHYANT